MAKFEIAYPYLISNEVGPFMHTGGYVNDPADPGGETKWGISKRAFPQEDIKNLTIERASQLTKMRYWHFDGVNDQRVATKVFDHYFNRPATIHQVQYALHITSDGIWGGNTEHSLNAADPETFLSVYIQQLLNMYRSLVIENPALGKFLKDWEGRANKLPQ